MRTKRALLLLLLAAALLVTRATRGAGAEPPAPPEAGEEKPPAEGEKKLSEEERARRAARAAALVEELGHQDWAVREAAQAELVGIGEPAEAALEKATESDDLEISTRAWRALLAIRGTGFIGIYIADGPEPAEEGEPRGALVSGLVRAPDRAEEQEEGPGGLRAGDIVVSVNGERVDGWPDLQRLVARAKPGAEARLRVQRGDKTLDLAVPVQRWPEDEFPLPQIPE